MSEVPLHGKERGCKAEGRCGVGGWVVRIQGYLAHKKHPLLGPYSRTF